MVISHRARLFALCAVLSFSSLGAASADPALKPTITGLISTGITLKTFTASTPAEITKKIPALFEDNNGKDLTGILGGLVIQIAWSTLEPKAPINGSVVLDTKKLEAALAAVDAYNSSIAQKKLKAPNNRPIYVRLRVYTGCNSSPEWANTLDGKKIVINAVYGKEETCTTGRFWDPNSKYAAAWRQFQSALAAQYDADTRIREVAVTSCTSFSAEPFFLPYSNKKDDTATQLNDATPPYNPADYLSCLEQAVPIDYAPWKTTRLEFSFNAFSGVTKSPGVEAPPNDVAASARVMRICRQTVGERCILSNHDIGSVPPSESTVLPIYAIERKFGPPLSSQAFKKFPADFDGTIRKAAALGDGAIEVWPDGYRSRSVETLKTWAAMFEPQ